MCLNFSTHHIPIDFTEMFPVAMIRTEMLMKTFLSLSRHLERLYEINILSFLVIKIQNLYFLKCIIPPKTSSWSSYIQTTESRHFLWILPLKCYTWLRLFQYGWLGCLSTASAHILHLHRKLQSYLIWNNMIPLLYSVWIIPSLTLANITTDINILEN